MPLGELFLGAFLGGFFNVLLDRLTSPELVRFLRQEGFETKINKWRENLQTINSVLRDAELKQQTMDTVKEWLEDLEELAYDAEDMLEEFEYEATARKMKMESSTFWKHVPAGFCNSSLDAILFRFRISSMVDDVTTRFDKLCERRQSLGLQVIGGEASSSSSAAPQRPATSAHRTELAVYGRDEDTKKILEMVLKNEPTDPANFLVIPIVGMGGVGKTTLAREVFIASKDEFEVNAWVCVSDGEFDVTRISKSILENLTGSASLPNDFATVQDQLKEQVVGKKVLLVLDDVWSSDYGKWQILQSPFTATAVGSRIIVTTRDEVVASKLRPSGFHRLDLLQREDCWLVFSMCAFENGAIPTHHEIDIIREKVIAKSKGLPLAAKTLGGLLRSEHIDRWLEILNNKKLWDLSEEEGSAIPAALKVSYHHLPSNLKRCFAYCAIFPKDHEFEIEEVVLLWIAEGFIQQSIENEQLEDLGHKYFSNLLGRSLFQQSSSNNCHTFVMHDLVHDLAEWAFGKRSLRLDQVSTSNRQLGGLKKVRHFSYKSRRYDSKERFEVFQEVEDLKARIRTFLPIPRAYYYDRYITNSVPSKLLPKLKRLRVLSLQKYCIAEVTIPIGGMKHLRYINLSGTMIRSLPESTSLLYNLQVLMLRDCHRLVKLPSNFKYLIKLCHFDIEGTILIKQMPLGMKGLKNLQKLSNFVVGKGGEGSSLKDLMSLKMLRGKLCIEKLDNVIDCDNKDLILRDKKDLEELLLGWESHFYESRSEAIEKKVLDMLEPHENLQKLTITYYGGTTFSRWVGAASYSKMKVLRLKNCDRCTSLPSLGVLGSLEELVIKGMKGLTCITSEFYGNSQHFKSLKTLCFEDLQLWADWEPIEENEYGEAFPCLKMLSIKKCPQLSGSLPKCLVALEELIIEKCEQLVVSNISGLCKIKIDGCKRIACDNPLDFKSMRYLKLSNISEFSNQLMEKCFGKAELQQIKHNRSDEICPGKPVSRLQSSRFFTVMELVISNCSNIVSFPEVCSIPHLSKLEIQRCDALLSLPEEMKIQNVYLESLEISCCASLAFIVRGQLPPSLKRLKISYCEKVESLWDDRENDKNTNASLLESLEIKGCNSLAFIVRGQLPQSLKTLDINDCEKLESLWDDREGSCSSTEGKENGNNTNSSLLEVLSVRYCPSLTCLSSIIQLSTRLKDLQIMKCPRLTTIGEWFLDSNTSLEVIWIKDCENLLQLPSGLHNLRHLRRFIIENCEKLKALPIGLRSLNSLEVLQISKCPSIASFNPEQEFPTSLESLEIEACVNVYRPLVEWGLQNLTSLTSLDIFKCSDVELFPQPEMTLPPTLTDLTISIFPKLKQLWSQGFQNLTSLQNLFIIDCPDLTSLGNEGLPSSLESLLIWDCPNLTCFPKQGLPSSLRTLGIDDCPKLKEECKRNKGREWSKISNILEVKIDRRHIFELEKDEEAQSSSCYRSWLTNPMHCCKTTKDDTLDGSSTIDGRE